MGNNPVVDSIFSVANTAAKTAILAEAPFLASPVPAAIFNAIFDSVAQKIESQFMLVLAQAKIQIQTNSEIGEVSSTHQALNDAVAKGNADEISQAQVKYQDALAALIGFDLAP